MPTIDLPVPAPPPEQMAIPSIPAAGPRRELAIRTFAARLVARLGVAGATLLAAEIDEAVADEVEAIADRAR